VNIASEPPRQCKRTVTFPADEAIATVHHLSPSSDAGDLGSTQEDAVAGVSVCVWGGGRGVGGVGDET
jgi:hypothetical protein